MYLKILYLKSKFRQFGAKIKTSSCFLENVYTSQFESAEFKSYWFWFLSNLRSILTTFELMN